jgi:carboxymethylenebutenolidase
MPITTRTESIPMPDGGAMTAHLCLPESGSGPGLLVLMEIFGVGSYIRRACERLAELGYVAMAPDLYRRVDPGVELAHDQAGLQQAMALVGQLDVPGAIADAGVALTHLEGVAEVAGHAVGAVGFCLGGTIAYHLAAVAQPATAVCYYGSGIADALSAADQIACPVLFHFGAQDGYIPIADAERVAAVAAQHAGWDCAIQPDGGHAFDNHDSEMFSRPEAAARAWELTSAFLARTLT